MLVNAGLFFVGTWLRNMLMLAISGASLGELAVEATIWAPIQGATTALTGLLIVVLFRDWLAIRAE